MRDCFITGSNGTYYVLFREHQVRKAQHHTTNYHDIGGWVSNWISNATLPRISA